VKNQEDKKTLQALLFETNTKTDFKFYTMEDAVNETVKEEEVETKVEETQETKEENNDQILKLFVGGIHHEVTAEQFKEYFSKFGEIEDIILMKDSSNPSGHRGYGFVEFKDLEVAKSVMAGSHELGPKKLDIKEAQPKWVKLYVGNFKEEDKVTEQMIEEYFSQYGRLNGVNKIRNFAFVTIEDKKQSDVVQSLLDRKHEIGGQSVDVKPAKKKERFPFAGGFGGYGYHPMMYYFYGGMGRGGRGRGRGGRGRGWGPY